MTAHKPTDIKGYRNFDQATVDKINEIKALAEQVGDALLLLETNPDIDARWLSIGRTDLQKGFMSVIRSIAKPTTF